MAVQDLLLDWHGTLYSDKDETNLWNYVTKKAMRDSIKTAVGAALSYLDLRRLAQDYRKGEADLAELYEVFNKAVLSHVPESRVIGYTAEYAENKTTQQKVDDRIIIPITEAQNRRHLRTVIISAGYSNGIGSVLSFHRNGNGQGFYYYTIMANRLKSQGKGSKFDMKIKTGEDKVATIKEIPGLKISPTTLFMTDSRDDDACAIYVKENGGRIAVPFLADDKFRLYAEREFNAFVPESEEDFAAFLKKA